MFPFLKDFKWRFLVIGLILAGILLLVGLYAPIGSQDVIILNHAKTPGRVLLESGEALTQRVQLPQEKTYRSLSLFAEIPKLSDRDYKVVIRDEDGVLVKTADVFTAYVPGQDIMRLDFSFPWIEVGDTSKEVFIDIYQTGGPLTKFLATRGDTDVYSRGEVVSTREELVNVDLALFLEETSRLPFGARQGFVAAAVFILGVVLLQFLPNGAWRWRVAAVLLILITILGTLGFWFSSGRLGIADWDYYFSLHHSYRASVVEHGAFPFWNPYTCGGTAGLGDPEFPFFTPTFLLEFLLDIPIGARAAAVFSIAVGGLGLLTLSKRLNWSVEAGLATAVIGALGTVNILEIVEGHVNVFAAMWIPWIFWAWLSAYRKGGRWPLVLALFLAITFYQGGIYLLMYTALAFLLLPFLVSKPRKAIRVTVVGGVWALGLAALKLLPVLNWLGQFPDDAYASSAFTLPWIVEILFGRHLHGTYLVYLQDSGWHEYGAYVGFAAGGLALLALSKVNTRIVKGLLLAFVLALFLSATGPALEPYFDLMWFFPRSNISRVILFAIIPLAILAGLGLDIVRKKFPHGKIVGLILLAVLSAEILTLTYQLTEQAFVLPPVYPKPEAPPHPIAFTPDRFDLSGAETRTTRTYEAARRGWGTFAYCSVLGPDPLVRTIADEEGSNELLLVKHNEGTWELESWSPNEVIVNVSVPENSEVVLNTNYAEGWYVNGQVVRIVDGRPGWVVAGGTHRLVFEYKTPGFQLGWFISFATALLFIFAVIYWDRWKSMLGTRS